MSPSSLPKAYKALVIKEAGKPLELIDVDLKHPGPGEVLVKVLACGVCHSDASLQEGHMGPQFPRVPGHEVVGDIVEVGDGVTRFKGGERVGGPWHGGHDGVCKACQRGLFQCCDNKAVNGVSRDGGYAEYVLLRQEAVVNIPKDMDPAEVAPLLCAGVTVYNGIRKMHVEQGGVVAILGLGGLGHLAVQYASKMGYRVVVLSSGPDKKDFATQLGAHDYVDGKSEDPVKRLKELGGADLIVATAPNPKVIAPLTGGLGAGGKILVLSVGEPVPFNVVDLVSLAGSVHGWPSGHALDSEEAIEFARLQGVKCMVEKFSLDQANDAMKHMLEGKVRFRGVLTM